MAPPSFNALNGPHAQMNFTRLSPALTLCCAPGAVLQSTPSPSSGAPCSSPKCPLTFTSVHLCSLDIYPRVQTSDSSRCSSSPPGTSRGCHGNHRVKLNMNHGFSSTAPVHTCAHTHTNVPTSTNCHAEFNCIFLGRVHLLDAQHPSAGFSKHMG